MSLKSKSGFTLLEIIIVIIIVGVLASLALPRLFSTVEFSKSGEALASFSSVRSSMERCYLQRGGNYTDCATFANLDLEDPQNSPNAHFTYGITANGVTGYTIVAKRNASDGGDATSTITIIQASNAVTRSGTSAFKGIK